MYISQLQDYFHSLADEILSDSAEIIAETATEYYKSTFRSKSFDGNPWAPAKVFKSKGSLLIDSGNLLNSIRPAVISPERVVISAGNDKVDYAAIHNEGYRWPVHVPTHMRERPKGSGIFHDVRAHDRMVDMVQRRFMGDSSELNDMIHDRIEGYIDSMLNK